MYSKSKILHLLVLSKSILNGCTNIVECFLVFCILYKIKSTKNCFHKWCYVVKPNQMTCVYWISWPWNMMFLYTKIIQLDMEIMRVVNLVVHISFILCFCSSYFLHKYWMTRDHFKWFIAQQCIKDVFNNNWIIKLLDNFKEINKTLNLYLNLKSW